MDGRVPVGAELDSINGHNVKSSRYEKIMSFFTRKDIARFKLAFRISSTIPQPQKKNITEPSRPVVDHQIRSERLDVAKHRQSVKQKFKMAIRRWRLSKDRGTSYVEYEVVCALKTGDSIKRWTVWKRYSQFRRLHREIQKSFGWQFEQSQAVFPAKTFFNDTSAAFNETRMDALNTYFKAVRTIPKIMEFDKHHSCVALRDFVEYLSHADKKVQDTSPPRSPSQHNSGSSRSLRVSRSRYSTRRGMRSSVGSRPSTSTSVREPTDDEQSSSSQTRPPIPPSNESTSSSDPRFAPFEKMQKMHLPEGAIRHKMIASGFSDSDIDSFLGGSVDGSNQNSNNNNSNSPSSSGGSVRDDPRFAPFAKMLQMHLPLGAIRHKMTASGFSDAEIDAFANNTAVSTSSSRPAPPRPSPARPKPQTARTKRSPATRRAPSSKTRPVAAPGNLLASIQGFNKKKLKKKGPPKKNKKKPAGPKKGSMQAILQAKLKARSMRLRRHESSSSQNVKRAAQASRKRVESERRSSFTSTDSNDEW